MDLSIIIVNWNSAKFLRECLRSIWAHPIDAQFEVIVIDNASYDGSEELVCREFPMVTFMQANENCGFACANNRAVLSSKGRNILFLNPDTEIIGNALQKLLDTLEDRTDAGIVGPQLVNPDLSPQIEAMRALPTLLNESLDSAPTRRLFRFADLWGVRPLLDRTRSTVRADMLPGTCIMLRREIFEAAGKFNEMYFMYAEDVELSYRVMRNGWTNYYVGGALVVHQGGCSSSQKGGGFSTIMMRESVWKFLRLTRGKAYANTYRLTTALISCLRIAVLAAVGVLGPRMRIRAKAVRSIRKWASVFRWCIGLEGWARKYEPPQARRGVGSVTSVY